MKLLQLAIGCIALGFVSSIAHGEELMDATIPLFHQKLAFKVQQNWKTGDQQATARIFLLELIPKTEDINSWTQLLAISAFKDMGSHQSAMDAYKIESASVVRNCPNEAVNTIIKLPNPQGYDSVSAIVGCLKHPVIKGRNEVAFYTFIKGKSDIYMVKKAFRESIAGENVTHLNQKNFRALAPEVVSIRLCKNDRQGPNCIEEAP